MFREVGITDLVDIAFMAALIYFVLISFKRSRAAFVLTGMLIVAAVYLVAQQFNLVLTAGVFQWFFAVIVFAWVVIFQEEIRRFFEQVAVWSFRRHLRRGRKMELPREEAMILVRTLVDLARERIGALIVLPGKNMIRGYVDGGDELNGQLSEPLLKSIFDPHSIGHDGAVIVEGNMITRFGVHLPLSKDLKKMKRGGTRHAAALGLSELSDSLCLVVSEERGIISAVRKGEIREIENAELLSNVIERFYHEIMPGKERRGLLGFFQRNMKEKLGAVGLALLLWFVQVYGSKIVYKTFTLPVEYPEPSSRSLVIETDPKEVEVTFSGPRRTIYFVRKGELRLSLKKLGERPGSRTARLSGINLSFPKSISLESIDPKVVTVHIGSVDEQP